MIKTKAKQAPAMAAVVSADTHRAQQIVDAAFDCAIAVLNTAATVATLEAPPVAAGFAFSAVTSSIACSTKLTLISSAASQQQYEQAAVALEMLNPVGQIAGMAGIGLGFELCSLGAWGNTAADLVTLVREAGNAEYVLGSLSRGRWFLAFLLTATLLKAGWNAAGALGGAPSNPPSSPSDDPGIGGIPADHSEQSSRFVPRGGPGQHPEP